MAPVGQSVGRPGCPLNRIITRCAGTGVRYRQWVMVRAVEFRWITNLEVESTTKRSRKLFRLFGWCQWPSTTVEEISKPAPGIEAYQLTASVTLTWNVTS